MMQTSSPQRRKDRRELYSLPEFLRGKFRQNILPLLGN
jgi:hypothetical protein